MNKDKFLENELNNKQISKFKLLDSDIVGFKTFISGVVLTILASQQPLSSKNLDLQENTKLEKAFDNFPAFLNVYGVGQKSNNNTYYGLGLKVHNENFEAFAENGEDYSKLGVIGKLDFLNSPFYGKLGAGYLNYGNYKVGNNNFDISQKTYGLALGVGNDNFNAEVGQIYHKLTGAHNADTTATTTYLEAISRFKGDLGQVDFTGIYKKETAYNESNYNAKGSLAYYPIDDLKGEISYDGGNNLNSGDYKVEAGFKYIFGGEKKGKFSLFVSGQYSNNSKTQTKLTYEANIANRPLSWKDEFENIVATNDIMADKIAPKEFKKRVLDNINIVPTISISGNTRIVEVGQNVTLTANASDIDGSIALITWYDENGNAIGTGTNINITEQTIGIFNYYAIAKDNKGGLKKSNNISVIVNEVANIVPTISISGNTGSVEVGQNVTLTANASDIDGSIALITWYDDNGNAIGTGTNINITEQTVGTFSYYAIAKDNKGGLKKSNNISVIVNEVANIAPTANISVSKNSPSWTQGTTVRMNATIIDENINTVSWQIIDHSNGIGGVFLNGNTGTGQFPSGGLEYKVGRLQGGQLILDLQMTDETGKVTTVNFVNEQLL